MIGFFPALARRIKAQLPAHHAARRRNLASRREGLARLAAYSRAVFARPVFRTVLVDGMWDNANYWTRYAILRRAFGLSQALEVGLLGKWNRDRVNEAFDILGISERFDMASEGQGELEDRARDLTRSLSCADDILTLELPRNLPPQILYDGILKRQRRAEVDIADPELPTIVADALAAAKAAVRVLDKVVPEALILSHAIDFTYGSLAAEALLRGIPTYVLFGDFGTLRFLRLVEPADQFRTMFSPSVEDLAFLSGRQRAALTAIGSEYLRMRFDGRTTDVGAIYAYRRRADTIDRDALCARFGWNPSTPIVGFFASNWYDYPHSCSNMPYRDFLAWVEATLAVAKQTRDVNWVFKAHPCDEWYGVVRGRKLDDAVNASEAQNCQLADRGWNGRALLDCLDCIVTFHGTVGIEAASLGLPVLTPYGGWYGHFGFVKAAHTRVDYEMTLATAWWRESDGSTVAEGANLFAGWYFGVPSWHGDYIFQDDAAQDAIWWGLGGFLDRHAAALDLEIGLVRDWHESGTRSLHIYKMQQSEAYTTPAGGNDPRRSAEDPRLAQMKLQPDDQSA